MTVALMFAGGVALAGEPETEPPIPAGSSEPTKCVRLIADSGLGMTVGHTIELCAGTVSASNTVACLIESWGPSAQGGLGLPLGLAIDLCRTIPREDD